MISVESLTKRFADAEAVRGISFHVDKGEIVGLLGPNGAGKTTTMRMLTCYVPPTSGRAKVAGFDIDEQSVQVRRNVGYLPESVNGTRRTAAGSGSSYSASSWNSVT